MSNKNPTFKQTVEKVELEARYFRGNFERMFYFMKAREIGPEYDAIVTKIEEDKKIISDQVDSALQPTSGFSQAEGSVTDVPTTITTTEDGNTEGQEG